MSILIVFLGACASYEGIREMEPVRVERYAGDTRPVGDCVLDSLRRRYDGAWDFTSVSLDNGKATRIGARFRTLIGGATPMFSWELALKQVGARAIDAEVRSIKTIWGNPQYPDDVWDFIAQCSSG